ASLGKLPTQRTMTRRSTMRRGRLSSDHAPPHEGSRTRQGQVLLFQGDDGRDLIYPALTMTNLKRILVLVLCAMFYASVLRAQQPTPTPTPHLGHARHAAAPPIRDPRCANIRQATSATFIAIIGDAIRARDECVSTLGQAFCRDQVATV